MKTQSIKTRIVQAVLFVLLVVSIIIASTGFNVSAKADTLTLPSSIENMEVMNATKAQPAGTLSVLPKAQVTGAENDVLWYNNSNLTTADIAYRWSYLNLRTPVTGGQQYNFSIRLRVFTGEETIGKPPTLNSFHVKFFTMSSIVYNAAANNAFVQFLTNADTEGAKIAKLGDMCTYFGPSDAYTNTVNTQNGEWVTFSGTINVPAKSPYNTTQYDTTDLVLQFQLEAADGEANTRNIYFDHIKVEPTIKPKQLVNMATSADYWKDGFNPKCFTFGDNGMTLKDTSTASMLLYPQVAANSTINLTLNGSLDQGWANCFIMLKDKSENPVSGAAYEASYGMPVTGNFSAFQFGADGAFWIECIDGEVEKLPAAGAADNNDIWYWYTGTTSISITTEDTEDGFSAKVKLNGKSGYLSTFDYTCYEESFKGDYAFSIAYFAWMDGTDEKNINMSSLTVSDVESVTLPDYNVAEINTNIGTYNTEITSENYATVKAFYNETASAYKNFNFPLIKDFNKESFDAIGSRLATYEKAISDAAAVDALIVALPTSITADNYTTVKADIEAARTAYNALGSASQALVTKGSELVAAEQALASYEKGVKDAADAAEVDALIADLPTSITADNYTTVKADIEAARTAYNALSEDSKTLVTKINDLQTAEQNLANYEASIEGGNEGGNQGGNEGGDTEAKGCAGNTIATSVLCSLILMGLTVIMIKKRKA